MLTLFKLCITVWKQRSIREEECRWNSIWSGSFFVEYLHVTSTEMLFYMQLHSCEIEDTIMEAKEILQKNSAMIEAGNRENAQFMVEAAAVMKNINPTKRKWNWIIESTIKWEYTDCVVGSASICDQHGAVTHCVFRHSGKNKRPHTKSLLTNVIGIRLLQFCHILVTTVFISVQDAYILPNYVYIHVSFKNELISKYFVYLVTNSFAACCKLLQSYLLLRALTLVLLIPCGYDNILPTVYSSMCNERAGALQNIRASRELRSYA